LHFAEPRYNQLKNFFQKAIHIRNLLCVVLVGSEQEVSVDIERSS
jgi:hypothetical protein